MKKDFLNEFFGEMPYVLVSLVALYQLGYAAIHGQWLLVGVTLGLFAAIVYLEKAANVGAVVFVAGAMLTSMETELQADVWHVALLIIFGLLAGYHLKLVEEWNTKKAREAKTKLAKAKSYVIIAAYAVSVCVGMYAVAYMSFSWINVALFLLFAQTIYEAFCTYRPKASDIRLVVKKDEEAA